MASSEQANSTSIVDRDDGVSQEALILEEAANILGEAQQCQLTAVELGHELCEAVGTDALAIVQVRYGSLLKLLEQHSQLFKVQCATKPETVALVLSPTPPSMKVAAVPTPRIAATTQLEDGEGMTTQMASAFI